MVQAMERHQVLLYLVVLLSGGVVGVLVPGIAEPSQGAINPVLTVLLFVTFLGIPLIAIRDAFLDWRFLLTILGLNFVIVPLVVFALTRFIAHDLVLLVGVLFVLLTPCIDYVIVFSGLAGGSADKLLATAPMLMLTQIVLLPFYFWVFVGTDFVATVDFTPFLEAFGLIIVVPLIAAAIMQWWASRNSARSKVIVRIMGGMVPLMMVTLFVVVTSQISGVRAEIGNVLKVIPIYILFTVVMAPISMAVSRVVRLPNADTRSVVFSSVTRNSLVVMPLVLALPVGFELVPLVVVTQTLIELVVMVILVRLIPRWMKTSSWRSMTEKRA